MRRGIRRSRLSDDLAAERRGRLAQLLGRLALPLGLLLMPRAWMRPSTVLRLDDFEIRRFRNAAGLSSAIWAMRSKDAGQ
jgi:hypothetical protein